MMNTNANPEMLILARELRGKSQVELAEISDVPQSGISRYEAGLLSTPPDELNRLADALDFPVEFFFRAGTSFHAEYFHRKHRSLSSAQLKHIHALLNLFRLNLEILLRQVDVNSPFTIPEYDIETFGGNIEEIAAAVRALWQMPHGHVRNVMECLEDAFCVIFTTDFGTDEIDEVVQWVEPMPPIMLVNSRAPGDRLRFTMAHALGHLVMHHGKPPYPAMEDEADQFAAAFLMPAKDIKPELKPVTVEHMLALKPTWKVSIQALIERAYQLEKISDRRRMSLYQMMSRNGYRKREPFPLAAERPTLLTKLLNLYQVERGYSALEIARLLNVYEHDLRNWYFPERTHLQLVSKKSPDSSPSGGYRSG